MSHMTNVNLLRNLHEEIFCPPDRATRSHGNSYIFYEVANSYDLVHILTIFAKFKVFQELDNLYDFIRLLCQTPTLNLPVTDKSYEWGRTNSYEVATLYVWIGHEIALWIPVEMTGFHSSIFVQRRWMWPLLNAIDATEI